MKGKNIAILVSAVCFVIGAIVADGHEVIVPALSWALLGLAAWVAASLID